MRRRRSAGGGAMLWLVPMTAVRYAPVLLGMPGAASHIPID